MTNRELSNEQREALIDFHKSNIHALTEKNLFWPDKISLVDKIMAEAHEIASLVPGQEATDAPE